MTWLEDKKKRDEEEARRAQAEREAARAQKEQEQQEKALQRAHEAAQAGLRPASEQKVNTAPLVVNMDTQTNKSAARVAARIPDENERDGFLGEYIAHVKKAGSPNYQKYAPTISQMRELTDAQMTGGVYADTRAKYDKQVQTRGEAMQLLGGMSLMGFDGQTINVNTADPATVVRGINSIADDDLRAKAAKAYATLAQTQGSRFYGESTDGVGDFLESANLSRSVYEANADSYQGLFYGDGAHDEEDAQSYLGARREIEEGDYSDYAKAQLTAALDKAYRGVTGDSFRLPSADTSLEEGGNERTTEDERKDEKKPGFFDGLFGKMTPSQAQSQNTDTAAESRAEDALENTAGEAKAPEVQGPVQQKKPAPEGLILAPGGMSLEEWSHPSTAAAVPLASTESATGGVEGKRSLKGEVGVGFAVESGVEGGKASTPETDAGNSVQKREVQTVGEAAEAALRGEFSAVEGKGAQELEALYDRYGLVRQVMGTFGEEDSRQILLGNEGAENIALRAANNMGQKFRTLSAVVSSDLCPKELKSDILGEMVVWAATAEEKEKNGTLGGGEEAEINGMGLMERYLTYDEEGQEEYAAVMASLGELNDQQVKLREERQQQSEQSLKEARQAVAAGHYSDEQLELVKENAKDVGYEQLQENGSWQQLKARQAETDAFLYGEGFENSSVSKLPDAQGVTDKDDYRMMLGDQMSIVLQEDAAVAYTLGMTLEEYYAKTGGMDTEQLSLIAAARIDRQGASLTEADIEAIPDIQYGDGVGMSYTLGAGIRGGAEKWYYDEKNGLYELLELSVAKRTAAEMQNKYQNEYGLNGREKYAYDLRRAAESGVWDETFAKAVLQALDKAEDPYYIGVDPSDVLDHTLLKGNKEIQNDLQTMAQYIAENGTEGENRWYNRFFSMSYNTTSALVSTGVTMLTGVSFSAAGAGAAAQNAAGVLGFNTGYSVTGWKSNFDDSVEKGYGPNAAKQRASLLTLKDFAVNYELFSKIVGQMTGANAQIETAAEIAGKAPTGFMKFLGRTKAFAAAALENTMGEVVHDEFYETAGENKIDAVFGPMWRKADAGEEIEASDWLDMLVAAVNPTNYDLYGTVKHVKEAAAENAIGALVFSVAGGLGAAAHTYDSVQKARDAISGQNDDIAGTLEAIAEDAKDPAFREAMNQNARQQQAERRTAEELAFGRDENGHTDTARHAEADAQRHEARAKEAAQTMEQMAQTIEEKQTALENGTGDAMTVQELSDAAAAYARAKQVYARQTELFTHRKEDAQAAMDRRMQEARQAARQAVKRERENARETLSEDRQARTAAIDSELAQLDAQDEQLQSAFTEALSGLSDAQEMGMDEDTLSELMARTDEIAERMAALEEARERITDPEAYAARQQEAAEAARQEQEAQTQQREASGAPNEEAVQTTGSQYSMGEVRGEAGQGGVDAGGLKNPVFQKFASIIYKNHGTEIVVANLMDGAKSAYDPRTNRLYISSKLGTGTAMRQALVHELMHSVEGSRGYEAYKEAAIQAAYHGDEADMRHDIERIREVYGAVYESEGRTLTETDVQKELITRATEKVIEQLAGWTKTGGETQIYDLLGEKQRFGVRLYNHLTQFIAKRKAKKNGTLEAYNELIRARDALKEALKGAKGRQTDGGTQYAITLDESNWPMVKADRELVLSKNPKKWNDEIQAYIEKTIRKDGDIQIQTLEGETLTINEKSQWHAGSPVGYEKRENNKKLDEELYRVKMNASAHLDEVAQVGVDRNPGEANASDHNKHGDFARNGWRYYNAIFEDYDGRRYLLKFSVAQGNQGHVVYNIGRPKEIKENHLSSVNAPTGRVPDGATTDSRVSEVRSSGDTSVAQSNTGVNPYNMQNPMEYALELNQFGNERARAADNLYDAIRKDLGKDAGINRRQVEEANRRYEAQGAEDMMAELSTREMWTADDVAAAAVIRKRAESEGRLMQAAMAEQLYRERMSRAGAALQAGSIYKKLTTSGAMAESLERANEINRKKGLTDGMIPMGDGAPVLNWREQKQKAENSLQYALLTDEQQQTMKDYERIIFKKVPEKVYDLYEAAYETQKRAEKKLHVEQISRDNPWGLPIEDWKTELIDRYKLRGTKLSGYNYFKASKKERMLAAILATRNNERGHGLLTLCQQLEFMDAGYAVVTEADLNYITGEMATFQLLEEGNDEPQTPEGKTAIQRIYSAQANTMPNSLWGKWNNLGYDNMLSSPKTWNKNVMSNILTRPLELTSERIASIADKQIAKKTGNRTTAMPSREARRAGNQAFAEEIANTLTDYMVRGVDTGHSSSFDFNNNRRTYNNAFMQTYHDFIAMAMQLGDRPFWEQCYAEEMRVLEELDTKVEEMRRTEGGNEEVVLRKMNPKEREEEAARRATERVFQEDNVLINGINHVRSQSKAADLVITSLMPFLKTPTNVAIRAMQYSPMGLAYTVVKNGLIDAKVNSGLGFDQRKFVMNLGRGLTGTGLMALGMALSNMGFIKPGREDEEDSRLSAIEKSSGKSYGMYFDIFGTQIPVDFAFPAVSPLIIGAEVADVIREHADSEDGVALAWDATKAMSAASLDQLCDNSMLQGVSSIFRGYKDNAQIVTAVLEGMTENTASRLTPASIRAVAKFTDPYVRDTKSQNGLRALLNAQIIQNWPILRQTLPKAQTITGEDMLQTGANSWGKDKQNAALHFLNSFITPWTAGSETTDAVLDELVDLAYRTDETSFLPAALVDGNKYSVTIGKTLAKTLRIGKVGVNRYESVTLHLTDEEKRWLNGTYADALFNGSGRKVTGLRALTASRKWQRMSDEEKMSAVKEEAAKAKQAVLEELVRRRTPSITARP